MTVTTEFGQKYVTFTYEVNAGVPYLIFVAYYIFIQIWTQLLLFYVRNLCLVKISIFLRNNR